MDHKAGQGAATARRQDVKAGAQNRDIVAYRPAPESAGRSYACGMGMAYDANGNTTSKTDSTGTTTYTWDYDNRLTSATLPGSGGNVSYRYDPFGRRIYKSSSSGTSIFAYDRANLIEEVSASGIAVARYTQDLNADEPLAMLRSGTTSFYEADGLGSITSLSNAAGAVAATYTYDSFGNVLATSGSIVNNSRYTGREFDSETGMYYYRARYYDSSQGRFLSDDPIYFGGGVNFYKYVSNNPNLFADPTGLCESPLHQFICHPLTALWVTSAVGFGTMGTTAVSTAGGSAEGGAILTVLGGGAQAEGLAALSAAALPWVGAALIVGGIAWGFYCLGD